MTSTHSDRPEADGVVLADAARQQVIQIAAELLGRLKPEEIPAPLRPIAKFTPTRRRQRGAVAIAAVVDSDADFRARVADVVAESLPALVTAVRSGASVAASDPADVATVAYLLRPDGWEGIVAQAGAQLAEAGPPAYVAEERNRLRQQISELKARSKADAARAKDAVAAATDAMAAEIAELKRTLRVRTGEMRAAERARDAAQAALADAEARVEKAEAARDSDVRRLRGRIADLERAGGTARREARTGRDVDEARMWLLLEALTDAAAGLRRELSLPPPSLRPADAVLPDSTHETGRAASDPAALDRLLALPEAHLIVDGYNVTKTGYPERTLAEQRERLIRALAPLAARCGAEVTVAFDGGARPPVQPRAPRGVRVLFSAGEIADDLIRRLVAAEPAGRTVVVVTSDQAVVHDVRRAGAWTASAAVLLRRLGGKTVGPPS